MDNRHDACDDGRAGAGCPWHRCIVVVPRRFSLPSANFTRAPGPPPLSQGIDTDLLWGKIKDVITKTLLAARPYLAHKYRAARPQLRKAEPPPAAVAASRRAVAAASQRARSRPAQPSTPGRAAAERGVVSPPPPILQPGPAGGPASPLASAAERSPGGTRRAASAGRIVERYPPLARVAQAHPFQAASAGAAVFSSLLAPRLPPAFAAEAVEALLIGLPSDPAAGAEPPPHPVAAAASNTFVAPPVTVAVAAAAASLPAGGPLALPAAAGRTAAGGLVLPTGAAALASGGTFALDGGSVKQALGVAGTSFSLVGKSVSVRALVAPPAATQRTRATSNAPGSARSRTSEPLSARGASGAPASSARGAFLPPLGQPVVGAPAASGSMPPPPAASAYAQQRMSSASAGQSASSAGGRAAPFVVVKVGDNASAPRQPPGGSGLPLGGAEGTTLAPKPPAEAPRSDSTLPRRSSAAAASTVDSMCSSTTAGSKPIQPLQPSQHVASASVAPKTPERVGSSRKLPVAAASSPGGGGGTTAAGAAPVFFPDDGEQGFRVSVTRVHGAWHQS